MVDWSSLPVLLLIFGVLFIPSGLWCFLRPKSWRKVHTVEGKLVFPASTVWQLAGVFVAAIFSIPVFLVLLGFRDPLVHLRGLTISLALVAAGLSMLPREIRIGEEGIEIRTWFRNTHIPWDSVQSLRKRTLGPWVLSGPRVKIEVTGTYMDFERLREEISKRLSSAS